MKLPVQNVVLLVLMCASATLAWAMRPTIYLANLRPKVNLEQIVPRQFDGWHELHESTSLIINQQQTELLKKLYSQTLSRLYINTEGTIVMLSIAYGANQSDAVALHYPEICYPAQGFEIISNTNNMLNTKFNNINVKRLITKLMNRTEPVTYWSTLGDSVVQAGTETKLAQLHYGIKGKIPDGLIVRVSTISTQTKDAFQTQDKFIQAMIAAMPPQTRLRFAGIPLSTPTGSNQGVL